MSWAADGARLKGPVHFLGLGGAGVSGAARVLAARGVALSGHDRAPSDLLRAFQRDLPDVVVHVGASDERHLPVEARLVVRSAAVPDDDPQVALARSRGVPVIKYAELLGQLPAPGCGLAVAGTHGKTTTSWMLWHVLLALAAEGFGRKVAPDALPGALVGGLLMPRADGFVAEQIGMGGTALNARAADPGGWFALEACEYDRSFLQLDPFGALVTNVEADHLDYYGTLDAIHLAFGQFAARTAARGLVVVGPGVPAVVEELAAAEVWRLGRELVVEELGVGARGRRFRLRGPGWATPAIELGVPGRYNVENAALALGLAIGLATRDVGRERWPALVAAAARGIAAFEGSGRRFETWGTFGAVRIVHDYAHHPTELAALLSATRETYPNHAVHVLFQPHQASRTARFLDAFVDVLAADDHDRTATGGASGRIERLVMAPVYGARRHIDGSHAAGSEAIAAGVNARTGRANALAPATLDQATAAFRGGLDPKLPTLALVVGAGDVEDVRRPLMDSCTVNPAVPT